MAEIAQGSAQLPVGAAVLGEDDAGKPGIYILDVDGELQLLFIDEHQSSLLLQASQPGAYSQGQGSPIQS